MVEIVNFPILCTRFTTFQMMSIRILVLLLLGSRIKTKEPSLKPRAGCYSGCYRWNRCLDLSISADQEKKKL